MVDISKEHAVETFKSLILVSLQGLKLLALFNGGAAVALLAYLGNVAGRGMPVPNMRLPMACYVAGLLGRVLRAHLASTARPATRLAGPRPRPATCGQRRCRFRAPGFRPGPDSFLLARVAL